MFKSTDFTRISKLNLVFWFSWLIILYYVPVYIELQRGLRDRDFVTKISIIITDAVNFDLETKNGKFPLLF